MVLLLCNSPQICSYTIDVLFTGLLAELPTILDSFYQYHKCLHRGGWLRGGVGRHDSGGLNIFNKSHFLDTTKSSQING